MKDNVKGRILSGMRPTGRLHIGHYKGVLSNWVALQDRYECFYMVADLHALTSEYADTSAMQENIEEMVIDWLACGLDPEKSVIFRQSQIKQHSELHLLLSMIVPLGWLTRCPTYKEQLKEIKDRDIHTYGFLGYPVLQAADILIYKADTVPVGEDQLPHLELSREIARRFNNFYGNVLVEPGALLTESPRVPGTDGRKMSKSYDNAIFLSDSEQEIEKKVMSMFTDPQKIGLNDKGHPEGCVVFAFQQMYSGEIKRIEEQCRAGKLGCVADKKDLAKKVSDSLLKIREDREKISSDKKIVREILAEGNKKAEAVAEKTMQGIRRAMNL